MPDTHALAERPKESQGQLAAYDAIVIGAGISGMYMLYRLRELGMTVRVFEADRAAELGRLILPNPSCPPTPSGAEHAKKPELIQVLTA